MSQTISHIIPENISKKKALRAARSTGACRGIAMGTAVILSIIPSIYIVANIVHAQYWSDKLVSIELNLLLLTICLWFFIAARCGWRAAKRTGQGAKIGAYSGFFFGLTSVVSAAATVWLAECLLDALDPYTSNGSIIGPDAIQPLLVIATITILPACIASGIGALFGALGGRIGSR